MECLDFNMKRGEYCAKTTSLNTSTYVARKCFLNIHQTKQSSRSPVQKGRIFSPDEVCKVLRFLISSLPLRKLCKTLACLVEPCIRCGNVPCFTNKQSITGAYENDHRRPLSYSSYPKRKMRKQPSPTSGVGNT